MRGGGDDALPMTFTVDGRSYDPDRDDRSSPPARSKNGLSSTPARSPTPSTCTSRCSPSRPPATAGRRAVFRRTWCSSPRMVGCGCASRSPRTRAAASTTRRWLRPAPHMPGWGRRRWCSTTCARCTSRPTPGTGSASRVLQGTPPGAADHHRAVDRRGRVPADGRGVRGQQGRDQDHAADDPSVHGRPPAHRRDGRRGRGDDLRGQPARDRGRRAVVHPRHADPRDPLRGRASGAANTPASTSPTGTSSPSRGRPARARTNGAATRSSTTSTGPTGPGARCAGSTSRSPRPRRPSRGRRRSSGTGSSSSPAPTRA